MELLDPGGDVVILLFGGVLRWGAHAQRADACRSEHHGPKSYPRCAHVTSEVCKLNIEEKAEVLIIEQCSEGAM